MAHEDLTRHTGPGDGPREGRRRHHGTARGSSGARRDTSGARTPRTR
ncbi:hypothetical protein LRS74_10295 [Streptomyces sp. LX-29]|nr:hypothetical protein [Streptomyces sp. LX-29]WFB07396.1 hypothetical protein LRS74_10295 [Streptomyces sp. LX-29]